MKGISGVRIGIDQFSVKGRLDSNYTLVNNILKKIGISLIKIQNIDEQTLFSTKLLIIPAKYGSKFLSSEIKTIIDYVVKGGALLILLDSESECTLSSNINEIMEILGIYVRCKKVKSMTGTQPIEIKIVEEHHDILKNVTRIIYPDGASFLIKKRITTFIILSTPSYAYPSNAPIIVGTKYGNGRVLVVGSYKIFDDEWILKADNVRLMLNIIAWLLNIKLDEDILSEVLSELKRPHKAAIPVAEPTLKTKAGEGKQIIIRETPIEREVGISREKISREEISMPDTKLLQDIAMRLEEKISSITDMRSILENLKMSINSIINSLTAIQAILDKISTKIELLESEVIDMLREEADAIATILSKLKSLENKVSEGFL